ncbi:MAG: FAD-binding oxidoreductase, partial [Thiotrichales bacterium]|nr:FAD-binding oxidoreductase [Thiotrichales bacterium]
MLFRNDASVYEISSQALLTPVNSQVLTESVREALQKKRHLTLRAGGTSLGGQAIGSGVVIDVSRHLTHILDYRPDEFEVDVEPGVIQ